MGEAAVPATAAQFGDRLNTMCSALETAIEKHDSFRLRSSLPRTYAVQYEPACGSDISSCQDAKLLSSATLGATYKKTGLLFKPSMNLSRKPLPYALLQRAPP